MAVEREWRAKLSIEICVTEGEQRGREMYEKCEEREKRILWGSGNYRAGWIISIVVGVQGFLFEGSKLKKAKKNI